MVRSFSRLHCDCHNNRNYGVIWCVCVCACWRQGRFTIAAKHHITIAEVYESELVDIEKVWHVWTKLLSCWEWSWSLLLISTFCLQAIAHYEQAADYYKGEESNRWTKATITTLFLCFDPVIGYINYTVRDDNQDRYDTFKVFICVSF